MKLEELLCLCLVVINITLEPPMTDCFRIRAIDDTGGNLIGQLAGQLSRPSLDGFGRWPVWSVRVCDT